MNAAAAVKLVFLVGVRRSISRQCAVALVSVCGLVLGVMRIG